MFITSLTDAELATLIIALKYWRSQGRDRNARKHDCLVSPTEIDVLLAKLRPGILASLPPEDLIAELFSR